MADTTKQTSHADIRGLPITAGNAKAVGHLDAAMESYLGFRRDTGIELKAALEADPDMPLAHCVLGYFFKLFGRRAMDERAAGALKAATGAAKKCGATQREQDHLAALALWLKYDLNGAIARWEAILLDHPLDVLALKLAGYNYFYLGDSLNLRDSVARVLHAWNEETPGHGYLLGMYAFGLEECADYANAEAMGQRAVEINPRDVWAIHAVAHVMEMQGRYREGTDWLKTSEKGWRDCNFFANHLWWHGALYLIELERYHAVLEGYDKRIRAAESDENLDLANAISLLWRLDEARIDVGDRWRELADRAEARSGEHVMAFFDAHFMMALGAGKRDKAADAMLRSMAKFVEKNDGIEARIIGDIGQPLCAGMLAFGRGDFERAVELLEPVRYDLVHVGGSHAQRDVFHRTLVTAAIESGRLPLARVLLSERSADRPTCIWNWRTYARVLAALDDETGAVAAWRKARDLLTGLTL